MEINYDCFGVIMEHLDIMDLFKWRDVNRKLRKMAIKEINRRGHIMMIKRDKMENLNDVAGLYKHLNLDGDRPKSVWVIPLSTDGWDKCPNLATLESLSINNGFMDCRLFPSLTKLIAGCSTIKHLTTLTNLTHFETGENGIHDKKIENMTNLTYLNLESTYITDDCIKKFENLEHLIYDGDIDIAKISKLTKLKTLNLKNTNFNVLGILPRFIKLESLKLDRCNLTDGIFTELSNLPSFKNLYYCTVSCDNHYANEIKLLKNMEYLNFCGCWGLTDDTLIPILENSHVKYINLSNCNLLTDAVFPYLQNKGTTVYWSGKLTTNVICLPDSLHWY